MICCPLLFYTLSLLEDLAIKSNQLLISTSSMTFSQCGSYFWPWGIGDFAAHSFTMEFMGQHKHELLEAPSFTHLPKPLIQMKGTHLKCLLSSHIAMKKQD